MRLLLRLWPVYLAGMFVPLAAGAGLDAAFPPPLESYGDGSLVGVWNKLVHRAHAEPFNVAATAIFLLAIVHTFFVAKFRHLAHARETELETLAARSARPDNAVRARLDRLKFRATIYHFLGEVEAVFGFWLVGLFLAICAFRDFSTAVHYIDGVNYNEAIFVTVIMAIASTRPVIVFAEQILSLVAGLLGGSTRAWWLAILTGGPLLGSLITEPAAMTLCALLLGQRFYVLQPSLRLRYATLGLLFVNISVGGTLTHFAAPPVVMVAGTWGWDASFMFATFGWKSIAAIIGSNALYGLFFRRELAALRPVADDPEQRGIPVFVTLVHLFFLVWVVINAHYPSILIIALLFFVAFLAATEPHQEALAIRGPLLVGFFLAALVAHGNCQRWWIEPVLGSLQPLPLMLGSALLTAFNDNAAITYLAALVPGFSDPMRYAVVAGAMAGGGLTVIANAPNPAGQSLLQKYFGSDGISPGRLFLSALAPTVIVALAYWIL